MGCKDIVLPEPFSKKYNVNCPTFGRNGIHPYNDNLCVFRDFTLHLHGNNKLEQETSKFFNLLLFNCEERDPSKFQAVHKKNVLKIEELLQLKDFL